MHARTATAAIMLSMLVSPLAAIAATATALTPTIESRDAQGKPISPDTFTQATKRGQRYTMKKVTHSAQFIMTLLPPGANPPGSMSFTGAGVTLLSINGVHYEVVFHDEHGKSIDQKAFAAGAVQHQRYATTLDKQHGKAITDKLGIKVYPTMIVVGADGKVLATRIGYDDVTPAKLERWVAASISGTLKKSGTN